MSYAHSHFILFAVALRSHWAMKLSHTSQQLDNAFAGRKRIHTS